MKKLMIFGFLALSVNALVAQKKLFVGVSGSVNASGFTYQNNYGQGKMDYDGLQMSPFFSAFVGVDFKKGNQLIIEAAQTEYNVHYKANFISGGAEYRKEVKLKYTSVPLLYRKVFGNGNGSHLFVTLGPQISFLNSASYSNTINTANVNFTTFVANTKNPEAAAGVASALAKAGKLQPDADDLYEKTSFDGVLGLGMIFPIGKALSLSAELRGGYAFSDINQKDWQVKGYEKNQVVAYKASHPYFGGLRIGVQYGFGK